MEWRLTEPKKGSWLVGPGREKIDVSSGCERRGGPLATRGAALPRKSRPNRRHWQQQTAVIKII